MLLTGVAAIAGGNDVSELRFSAKVKGNEVVYGQVFSSTTVSASVAECLKYASPLSAGQATANLLDLAACLLAGQPCPALWCLPVFLVLLSFPGFVDGIVVPPVCQFDTLTLSVFLSPFYGLAFFLSVKNGLCTARDFVVALLAMGLVSASTFAVTEERVGEGEFSLAASA